MYEMYLLVNEKNEWKFDISKTNLYTFIYKLFLGKKYKNEETSLNICHFSSGAIKIIRNFC